MRPSGVPSFLLTPEFARFGEIRGLYERNLPEEDLWIINSAKKRFQDALIEEKVRQLETELKSVRDIRKNLEDQSPLLVLSLGCRPLNCNMIGIS